MNSLTGGTVVRTGGGRDRSASVNMGSSTIQLGSITGGNSVNGSKDSMINIRSYGNVLLCESCCNALYPWTCRFDCRKILS